MAGVMFYGSGAVYVPAHNNFIRFVDGKYETVDEEEILLLCKKYKHDSRVVEEPLYEEPVDKPKRGRKPKNADGEN